MRQALTIARRHDTEEFEIVKQPGEIGSQLQEFFKLLRTRDHSELAEVCVIELDAGSADSTAHVRRRTFTKPVETETETENLKPKKSKNMKTLISLLVFAVSLFTANAASWNDAYGLGDGEGSGYFSASGAPLAVVGSVQSNTVYVSLGGPSALGAPLVDSVWIKPDLTGCTLSLYVATNYWLCASNQPAGTNIVWLTSTNTGLSTNDLLVLQNSSGVSQLVILGGGSTDAGGLVYTNSSGYVGVKLWNTPTNSISANDKLYKLALRQQFTPLTFQNLTNDIVAPWGNWWAMATRSAPLKFYGSLGVPSVLALTYSNSAGILVNGSFARRPAQ